MPLSTFHNLPQSKRTKILETARRVFAEERYDRVTITGLVAALGIAKGSFYQYFASKMDLFQTLVAEAGTRKIEYASTASAKGTGQGGIFGELRDMYRGGLRFMKEEPVHARILARLTEPSTDPELEAVRKATRVQAVSWMRNWLINGQRCGEIRHDIDIDVTTHVLLAMLSEGLSAAAAARWGFEPEELARTPALGQQISEESLLAIVDGIFDVMCRGIQEHNTEESP